MVRRHLLGLLVVTVAATLARPAVQAAQTQSLGSVRLPRAVMANGALLTAGSYTARLSADAVTAVVGQTPTAARWVEFLQAGQVKGRELATVLSADEVAQIAESSRPAAGTAKVEVLKGDDYVRVWINRGGTHYIIHLSVAPRA